MTVLRYIHQNPIKAKMVNENKNYKWSSYNDYLDDEEVEYVDKEFALGIFGGKEEFVEFMDKLKDDECLELDYKKVYTDKQLKDEIEKELKIIDFLELDKKERDKKIVIIKKGTGVSVRQLSRVLGVDRGIVQRAK